MLQAFGIRGETNKRPYFSIEYPDVPAMESICCCFKSSVLEVEFTVVSPNTKRKRSLNKGPPVGTLPRKGGVLKVLGGVLLGSLRSRSWNGGLGPSWTWTQKTRLFSCSRQGV